MSGMSSRPVQQTVIYPQPTQPTDERDGVLWVDTSTESRQLSVYSEATSQWEPVKTDVPFLVTQEAVSYTETGVSVAHNGTEVRNGTVVLQSSGTGNIVSRNADDDTFGTSGKVGLKINPNTGLGGVTVSKSSMVSGITHAYLMTGDASAVLDTATFDGGSTAALKAPMEAGTQYIVAADADGSSYTTAWDKSFNSPWAGTDLDITGGYSPPLAGEPGNLNDLEGHTFDGPGDATVSWDSLPEDLAAWDIATWQVDLGDGSMTTAVEYNDGSGWSTLQADAVAPYDVSGLDPETDVRLVHDLDTTGMSPRVSYDARRGER